MKVEIKKILLGLLYMFIAMFILAGISECLYHISDFTAGFISCYAWYCGYNTIKQEQ